MKYRVSDCFGYAQRGCFVPGMPLIGCLTKGGSVRPGFCAGRLLPRPRAPQYQLETEQELPVTFEIFLAWIVVQAGLDSG